MHSIQLGPTGRDTTRLGFGGSSIMGALGRRDSLRMLEAAFDTGIRHFDVAPMYGFGEAEGCVGEFAARHPGQVTLTTKFGLPPEKPSTVKRLARSAARPLLARVPVLKQRAARIAAAAAPAAPQKAAFTAERARQSLERSLRALRTDHIDVWLLHEATAEDLDDETLLLMLQNAVRSGAIGAFGVGSSGESIPALIRDRPAFSRVLQFEWSVLDHVPETPGTFRLHHRALTSTFRSLHARLRADPARCRRWSDATGADLADREQLARLMLKAALVMNPESVILFSSKSAAHIRSNVDTAESDALTGPARRLYALVQAEREAVAHPS